MQPEFESRLGADVRALVRDTEQLIDAEITVTVDPKRARNSPDEPGRMGCAIDEYGAQILIGELTYFPDASVFHELQHIRRILVEGAPRLVVCEDFEPWSPELSTAMTQLDNNLEHLVIVPIEMQRYPDRHAYWRNRLERLITSLEINDMQQHDRHRIAMLGLLLTEQMLPDANLRSKVVGVLRKWGIEDRAERYCAEAIAALVLKEQLVRTTFRYFELPTTVGCLEYLDSRNGSTRLMPLHTIEDRFP
jgi:hypothetical protein